MTKVEQSLLVFIACLWTSSFGVSCELTTDVIETLKRCIPGVQVKVTASAVPDTQRKYFEVLFEQPVDHFQSNSGTFRQRLILAHRDYDEPLILQTSGYSIFKNAPTKLTIAFDTNQLQVEHRFFSISTPEKKDWSRLNIAQSAADFHRIVVALKEVYRKAWINTGASKGGMTSIYHRRFYSSDVDGTLADVAPHSYTTWDGRYTAFLDEVGGKTYGECRTKLSHLQTHLLEQRKNFQSFLKGKFDHLGGMDVAFEHAVEEMVFFYWQYKNPKDVEVGCEHIPGPQSADAEVLSFFEAVTHFASNYGDEDIAEFLAYYYQAATELGSPALKRSHLEGLLLYPFTIDQYTPKGVTYQYSDRAMRDIEDWVRTNGERLIFTYGEYDPWTAGMFPKSASHDCYWNIVPEANHRSNIFYLPEPQKTQMLEIVARWLGKKQVPWRWSENLPTLDTLEFQFRSQHRL